jgi:acetylornithine deacetylase
LTGREAHASSAPNGTSAIAFGAQLINELYSYQAVLAEEGNDPRFLVPHGSVNVGLVSGGTAVNVVAGGCSLDVEVRALTHQDVHVIAKSIEAIGKSIEERMRLRAREASVTIQTCAQYPGLDTSDSIMRLIAELAESGYGGALDFGTEAGAYRERLGVPTVVCGPGDIAQAHTVDEFIELAQLLHAERFLHRLGDWLCRV